jgi:hypothetical protein
MSYYSSGMERLLYFIYELTMLSKVISALNGTFPFFFIRLPKGYFTPGTFLHQVVFELP